MSAFLLFLTPSTLLAGEAVPDIEEIHDGSNYRKEPDSRQGLVCDDCLQNSREHIYYSIFYWDLEKTRSNLNINNNFFVLCVILEGSIWFLWKV